MGLTDEDKDFIKAGIQIALDQGTRRIEGAVTKTIDSRFTAFGFDIKSPIEVQRDMVFLTALRKMADSIATKIVLFLVAGAAASAFLYKLFPKGGNGQ